MDGDYEDVDSDSDWDNMEDEEEEEDGSAEETSSSLCLFCQQVFSSATAVYQHCKANHSFDLLSFCVKNSIDAIGYIKMINYIRKTGVSPSQLKTLCCENEPWTDDSYMKPVISDDPLLMFDVEGYVAEKGIERSGRKRTEAKRAKREYDELLQKLATSEAKLQEALRDIEKMRVTAAEVILQPLDNTGSRGGYFGGDDRARAMEEDELYFSSYSHFGIHHEMLLDKVRTQAYHKAIVGNAPHFKGKMVMDVGCGTGILSMFAATAGAKHVYGVDQSDIIYSAMDIVRENGLSSVVTLCKGRVEDVNLPCQSFDVILSEWMGYFLLFEGMIETILYARDKYLAPRGILLPNRCTMSIAAIDDRDLYDRYIGFWDDVYGYRMTCMKKEVVREATIDVVLKETIISNPVIVKELDLMRCTLEDAEFTTHFQMEFQRDGAVTAITGYFDSYFEEGLSEKVHLSTSPYSESTHWKQTVFLLAKPIKVRKGEVMKGKITCRMSHREQRTLVVSLSLGNWTQMYCLM